MKRILVLVFALFVFAAPRATVNRTAPKASDAPSGSLEGISGGGGVGGGPGGGGGTSFALTGLTMTGVTIVK